VFREYGACPFAWYGVAMRQALGNKARILQSFQLVVFFFKILIFSGFSIFYRSHLPALLLFFI
jgi:hypothetical protein